MPIIRKPNLNDLRLRLKLLKGMDHNLIIMVNLNGQMPYFIFIPICSLATLACCIGLSILEPTPSGNPADPFAAPLEILSECYFFPAFNLLRSIPNKLLRVLSMVAVLCGLAAVPYFENVISFDEKFTRFRKSI